MMRYPIRQHGSAPAEPTLVQRSQEQPIAAASAQSSRAPGMSPLRRGTLGHTLRQLQQSCGNRYVQGVVEQISTAANPAPPPVIQTKSLSLGPVNDKYEREADRIAQRVVGSSSAQAIAQPPLAEPTIMRQPALHGAAGGAVDPGVQQAIQRERGSGQALPEGVRISMEQALGADFSEVRLHTDAQANTLNHALQARAFTTGRDIFLRRGAYNPGSQTGQRLLAHELTHVVQQTHLVRNCANKQQIGSISDTLPSNGAGVVQRLIALPDENKLYVPPAWLDHQEPDSTSLRAILAKGKNDNDVKQLITTLADLVPGIDSNPWVTQIEEQTEVRTLVNILAALPQSVFKLGGIPNLDAIKRLKPPSQPKDKTAAEQNRYDTELQQYNHQRQPLTDLATQLRERVERDFNNLYAVTVIRTNNNGQQEITSQTLGNIWQSLRRYPISHPGDLVPGAPDLETTANPEYVCALIALATDPNNANRVANIVQEWRRSVPAAEVAVVEEAAEGKAKAAKGKEKTTKGKETTAKAYYVDSHALHWYYFNQRNLAYDETSTHPSLFKDWGYTQIFSGNTAFTQLPSQLSEPLTEGNYIFDTEDHSVYVTVLQTVHPGNQNLPDWRTYFKFYSQGWNYTKDHEPNRNLRYIYGRR